MPKSMLAILFILLFAIFAGPTVHAGDKTGNGGGVGVSPRGDVTLLDLLELGNDYLILDQFPETQAILKWITSHHESVMPFYIKDEIGCLTGLKDSSYCSELSLKTRPLTFKFTNQFLPTIDDTGVVSLNNEYTREQAAIQRDGVVIIQKKLFLKMDDLSKASLLIHESLIRLVLFDNPSLLQKSGTQPIRKVVRMYTDWAILHRSIPQSELVKAFEDLGIH